MPATWSSHASAAPKSPYGGRHEYGTAAGATLTHFASQAGELAGELKQAASAANLGAWTRALTEAAIRTCSGLGLMASAKGHKLELLPIHRSEYLALDVMAFAEGEKRWRFPVAVMELENSAREDQIAYSL